MCAISLANTVYYIFIITFSCWCLFKSIRKKPYLKCLIETIQKKLCAFTSGSKTLIR